MRLGFSIIGLAWIALAAVTPARAQVVINQQALQQLSGKPAAPSRPPRRERHHIYPHHPEHRPEPEHHRIVRHRPLPLPPPPPPSLVIAPPAPPPKPPPPPPKPRVLMISFPGVTRNLPDHATLDLQHFVGVKPDPAAHFIVKATAPGEANDPSLSRRRALDRGMAVRSALRQAGIASDHIIVQALGNPPGMPDNRVVLTEIP